MISGNKIDHDRGDEDLEQGRSPEWIESVNQSIVKAMDDGKVKETEEKQDDGCLYHDVQDANKTFGLSFFERTRYVIARENETIKEATAVTYEFFKT